MLNLLSLPRASWKVRLFFLLLLAVFISLMVQQWPHRHDELAIARWIAWFSIIISLYQLPRLIVVVLFGRLPKVYQRMFKGLSSTVPQIHADVLREQQERRERSREI